MKWYRTYPRICRQRSDTFEGWLWAVGLYWGGTDWKRRRWKELEPRVPEPFSVMIALAVVLWWLS